MFGHFLSEQELERELIKCCLSKLRGAERDAVITRGFGLDLAIFSNGQTKFMEAKAFAGSHGRCPIGNGTGGNQMRLLWDDAAQAPRSGTALAELDRCVRWIVCQRDLSPADERFAWLLPSEVIANAAGGLRPGKHNNLRLSGLRWIDDQRLEDRIADFLI